MSSSFYLILFGRFSQVVYLFLSFKVLTNFLPQKEVGLYFLLLSITYYISYIQINPVGQYFYRFIHDWKNKQKLNKNIIYFLIYLLILCLINLPILYFCYQFFDFNSVPVSFFIINILFYVISTSLNNTIVPGLNILLHRNSFVILTFLSQYLSLALSIYLIYEVQLSSFYWLLGQSIGFFVMSIVSIIYIFKKIESPRKVSLKSDRNYFKNLFKFCLPILGVNIFLSFLSQFYRPYSEVMVGLEYLSLIGLGFGLAASISTSFEYLFQQLFYPQFYKNLDNTSNDLMEKSWNQILNICLPSFILILFFLIFLAPFIVSIMSSSEYQGAVFFLIIGAMIEFFRIIASIFNLVTHMKLKTSKTFFAYTGAALITLLLCLLLYFYKMDKVYIPYVFLLGNFFALLFVCNSVKKLIVLKINYKKIAYALLFSIPFSIASLFYSYQGRLIPSILLLSVFLVYFAIIQYKFNKKFLKGLL